MPARRKDDRAGGSILTTLRCDALVLGSNLGGLIAANYMARAGLRVLMLEEEGLSKRPALLRDPFLLSGLESGGVIHRVLRELALPLIEQRQLQREPIALQVLLADAWLDLPRGRSALAREFACQGFGSIEEIEAWFGKIDDLGQQARHRLWSDAAPAGARPRSARGPATVTIDQRLPVPPQRLARTVEALLMALTSLQPANSCPVPALLLRGTREGSFQMPHSGQSFHGLFQRRLRAFHGEIQSVDQFRVIETRKEIGIELERDTIFARALVIAAPREGVQRFLAPGGPTPRWLQTPVAPLEQPQRLFRAEKIALPAGMATHGIRADDDDPERWHWWSTLPDWKEAAFSWLVLGGPGAAKVDPMDPLPRLAPFSDGRIIPVDIGPPGHWDRDSAEVRFLYPGAPAVLCSRPLITTAGPELAPGLGFIGEVLQSRQIALHIADRLGARKRGL